MQHHVVVIGAGIVGTSAALALLRDGCRVTLLDPGSPGGEQAASFGNGAWISPASVVPMSMPGLWRKVPGFLLDPSGPLTIRPTSLPTLVPWLLRFVLAGATVPRVEATARALATLLGDAPERHAALAAEVQRPDLVRRDGLLYVYPDRGAFEAEAFAWRLRREAGLVWDEVDEASLRAREPALSERYRFGIHVAAGAHCPDPGAFVAALADRAVALGATLMPAPALGFDVVGGRLKAVRTRSGPIACDRAVIAAGIGSASLSRAAGDPVSLAAERGYHVVVASPGDDGPRGPVMPSDGKMANTPTAAGLRAAGQVELARPDVAPDWRRADILHGHLRRTWPQLADRPIAGRWMGCRPSTPDGLPVIGRASGSDDIVHAFGHGHVGLAAGPMTGQLVADILAARPPTVPLAPFRPRRFGFIA